MASKKEITHFDGWGKFLTGYQNRQANKAEVEYKNTSALLSQEILEDIWVADGNARRVISCVAEDMVNKGFTIVGDSANIVLAEVQRLNAKGIFYDAMCQSRQFGGSAILIGLNDGLTLETPVSVNSIKGINFLRVIPRKSLMPDTNTVDRDPNSPDYGKPIIFEVNDGISPTPYKIHKSRLFLFPWLEASPIKSLAQTGGSYIDAMWGTPVLHYIYKQIGNLSIFHDSLANLMQEACIGKYKISGLSQLFANGEEKKIMKRLDIINESKSVINSVIIDADNAEDYERDTLSFSGMNGVADTMMVMLSAVSGIPVTRLFGRSPSGLDASGESDLKIYYDMVSAYRDIMLTSAVQRLVFYIDIYKKAIMIEDPQSRKEGIRNGKQEGKVKKIRPLTEADIEINWNPLYQMTEKEQAETYFTNAQADMYYVQNGIISREECRINRFLGGYNQKMSVETADLPPEDSFFTNKNENSTTSQTGTTKGQTQAGKKL